MNTYNNNLGGNKNAGNAENNKLVNAKVGKITGGALTQRAHSKGADFQLQ